MDEPDPGAGRPIQARGVRLVGGAAAVFYTARPLGPSKRPVVLMTHGILRSAADLAPWLSRLDDVADVALVDLPGHGRSDPIASAALPALGEALHTVAREAFGDRDVLLVGESVSGLIALEVGGHADPGPVRAVLAADPPMTTAKQWTTIANLRDWCERHPERTYVGRLGHEVLGVAPDTVEDRVHYPLIGALNVPALIVTGDVPLSPPRVTDAVTCVFEDVDRETIEAAYPAKVEIRRIADCGHLLLVDAVPQMAAIIREMLGTFAIRGGAPISPFPGPAA